jgi:uridine phosphorylase
MAGNFNFGFFSQQKSQINTDYSQKRTDMKESDLIINPDGSIYHLKIKPEEVPDLILVSGDPARITLISDHFEHVEFRRQNREFVSHAGWLKGKRILALSTGIGPDNIDIVMNELDALVNIDLKTREPLKNHRTLTIVRIGTSGTIHADIPVGALVIASHGMGMDGSLHYYRKLAEVIDPELTREFIRQTDWPAFLPSPYIIPGTKALIQKLSSQGITGITATAGGFYGPQGRELRLRSSFPGMLDVMAKFSYKNHRIINFEMETSSIYGLGTMLGHQVASICVLLANRSTGEYTKTIKDDEERLITYVLEKMTS